MLVTQQASGDFEVTVANFKRGPIVVLDVAGVWASVQMTPVEARELADALHAAADRIPTAEAAQ